MAAVAGIAAGLIAGAVTGYTVVRSLDDSREAPAPTTTTAIPPSGERSGAVPVSARPSSTTALPTTAPPAAPPTAPSSSAPFAATPPVEVGAEEPTPISVVLDDVGHVVDDTQELVGEVVEELPRLDGLPALPGLG